MPPSRRTMILRRVKDGLPFAATVLVAFWAMGDRSPARLTALYVAVALAAAIVVRRTVASARARRNDGC